MTFRRLRKRTCALSSLYRPAPAREPAKHLKAARHFRRIVIQLVCEPCFLPCSSGHEHGFRTDCKIIFAAMLRSSLASHTTQDSSNEIQRAFILDLGPIRGESGGTGCRLSNRVLMNMNCGCFSVVFRPIIPLSCSIKGYPVVTRLAALRVGCASALLLLSPEASVALLHRVLAGRALITISALLRRLTAALIFRIVRGLEQPWKENSQ